MLDVGWLAELSLVPGLTKCPPTSSGSVVHAFGVDFRTSKSYKTTNLDLLEATKRLHSPIDQEDYYV